MAHWQAFWQRITSPVATIEAQYERERIALYSALLFILTIMFLLVTIIIIAIPIQSTAFKAALLVSSIASGILYGLSRTLLYKWTARIHILLTYALIVFAFLYIAPENSRFVLSFFAVPIMVSGFLLSRRETLLNIIISAILVIFAEYTHPDYDIVLSSIPILLFLVGCITLTTATITERYYREVVDSEARYRSLMQANFEGIIVVNKDDARILDINPAVEKILGYSPSEMLNHMPIEFVSSEDKDKVDKIWARGAAFQVSEEIKVCHKLGFTVYIEVTMRPYTFLNKPAFVLTLLDVSDRKQVETLMLESEKRFRAIFNESSHYIGILDTSGRVLEFNQVTYNKFGLVLSDVLGHYLWDFDNWAYTDRLKARTKKLIQDALNGQSIRHDMIALDKDGQKTYMDFTMKAIMGADNSPQMLIIESRDTTAYQLENAKRTELQQRYQAIFEHTTDAVFIFDMQGKFIAANQRGEEMLQVRAEDILNYSIYDFVVTEEREYTTEVLSNLITDGSVSVVPERKMQRANGEVFYAETLGMIVRDSNDKPRYVQSMVRDVSERKRQEKVRFDSALQHERTQLLTHFIENASHHFRTPITNMKTRLYLLPRVLDKPEKRDEQIVVLGTELDRMQNLLDDLLSVLRLQKDDTEYSLAKVPVSQLLIEVQQSFAGRSKYGDFQWIWQGEHSPTVVIGDKARLGQAIFNLVENAMTYTPQNGDIIIRSFNQQDYVVIDVINTGDAIPEIDLPFIFDDFYRGQDAMEQDSTSTGLGLTIAKMIVERHQGIIYVKTPEGGGAHFQILLPIHTDWQTPAPPLPPNILFPEPLLE